MKKINYGFVMLVILGALIGPGITSWVSRADTPDQDSAVIRFYVL
jgi:hypothetical protein